MPTLLLVDDVKTTLAVEKSFLESRNLKVFVTTSPMEGLRLASSIKPDLIVLDYEMPEMNGDELCVRLKKDPATRNIPVLIISAHDDKSIPAACERAGAAGYCRKTEGRESLLDQVAGLLGMPQRRHVRVPCSITIGILSGGRRMEGIVHNISVGGMYLTVDTPLDSRGALRMKFDLEAVDATVEVLGEIVRSEELSGALYGYGIQLIEADEGCLEALGEYVARTL
ncbi:MAG TPA: response regulator [Candidatus Saccharimonadales bacterium]|nr:response regulator [Candidatus Saccharimonadales bacterium]